MKVQLLPSSFEQDGSRSARQHLACLIVNDRVAIDAGSLAMAVTDDQRQNVRDIVLTHAHLDHIAGLPLFVDDLFAQLNEPIRIHARQEVIDILERDIFNWSVFPRFSELTNNGSPVLKYFPIECGSQFAVSDLTFRAIEADHRVPSAGYVVSDTESSIVISGDTAHLDPLNDAMLKAQNLKAILVECAFPNELEKIACQSHHMTPAILAEELAKLKPPCPVFVINIKPNYRRQVVDQLEKLEVKGLGVMSVGDPYFW